MSFKLLVISSMYTGYIDSFNDRHSDLESYSYEEHMQKLLGDSTEFVASYNRAFRRLGVEAECIIANARGLQTKWFAENSSGLVADRDILTRQVSKYKPDILWIENLSYTDKDWLLEIRRKTESIKLIVAYHCSPFNSKIIERFKYVDFVITCTPGLLKELSGMGIKSHLVYHGFDHYLLERLKPGSSNARFDFLFSGSLTTGSKFHGERIALIEELLKAGINMELFVNLEDKKRVRAKKLLHFIYSTLSVVNAEKLVKKIPFLEHGVNPVEWYSGNLLSRSKPPVYGIDMYNLFVQSKIVLNYHVGVAGNYAGNMRLFEVTGTGSCLLTDNRQNLSDLFEDGKEIVSYESSNDCVEKAKWLLDHDSERQEIACAGQRKTLKMHSVEKRCLIIIDLLNKELK